MSNSDEEEFDIDIPIDFDFEDEEILDYPLSMSTNNSLRVKTARDQLKLQLTVLSVIY